MIRSSILFPWVLVALIFMSASHAIASEAVYGKPLYFEPNDTYYELVSIRGQYAKLNETLKTVFNNTTDWNTARKIARQRLYKGRRGRLAVVKSKAINDFLRDSFKLDVVAWIGLRYICKYNKFMWVTGEVMKPGDYRNFGRVWNTWGANGDNKTTVPNWRNCFGGSMPVHYWPLIKSDQWGHQGFRWTGVSARPLPDRCVSCP